MSEPKRKWTLVTTGMVRQMRDLVARGVVQKRVAAMVGVHERTVSRHTRGVCAERLKARDRILAELWPQPISTREIGRRFGVTGAAISISARRIGLPPRKNYNPATRMEAAE